MELIDLFYLYAMEITINLGENAHVDAYLRHHSIYTDQPIQSGGEDSAPTPYELFLASIGTCAGFYIQSFCHQRNIPTQGIQIKQSIQHHPDSGLPMEISMEIILPNDFPEKYKESLIQVAEKCKVKKAIAQPPAFHIHLRNNQPNT